MSSLLFYMGCLSAMQLPKQALAWLPVLSSSTGFNLGPLTLVEVKADLDLHE